MRKKNMKNNKPQKSILSVTLLKGIWIWLWRVQNKSFPRKRDREERLQTIPKDLKAKPGFLDGDEIGSDRGNEVSDIFYVV